MPSGNRKYLSTSEMVTGVRKHTKTPIPHMMIPGDYRIFRPSKYDVLCGRGKPIQDHTGNLRMRDIVAKFAERYLHSRKHKKQEIVDQVVQLVKHSDGILARFLKRVGRENYWVEVSDAIASDKVSHALRCFVRKGGTTSDYFVGTPSSSTASAVLLSSTYSAAGSTSAKSENGNDFSVTHHPTPTSPRSQDMDVDDDEDDDEDDDDDGDESHHQNLLTNNNKTIDKNTTVHHHHDNKVDATFGTKSTDIMSGSSFLLQRENHQHHHPAASSFAAAVLAASANNKINPTTTTTPTGLNLKGMEQADAHALLSSLQNIRIKAAAEQNLQHQQAHAYLGSPSSRSSSTTTDYNNLASTILGDLQARNAIAAVLGLPQPLQHQQQPSRFLPAGFAAAAVNANTTTNRLSPTIGSLSGTTPSSSSSSFLPSSALSGLATADLQSLLQLNQHQAAAAATASSATATSTRQLLDLLTRERVVNDLLRNNNNNTTPSSLLQGTSAAAAAAVLASAMNTSNTTNNTTTNAAALALEIQKAKAAAALVSSSSSAVAAAAGGGGTPASAAAAAAAAAMASSNNTATATAALQEALLHQQQHHQQQLMEQAFLQGLHLRAAAAGSQPF